MPGCEALLHGECEEIDLLFGASTEFFKGARFAKVKSPAELIAGVMRLVDDYTTPKPNIHEMAFASAYMGQDLLNPPTVEGWHTGREWIDSGALVERINFAADQVGNVAKPGVRRIIERLTAGGDSMTAEQLVDSPNRLAEPALVCQLPVELGSGIRGIQDWIIRRSVFDCISGHH